MSDFVFQSTFQNVNFKKACKALKQRRTRAGSFLEGWIGFIGGALGVGAVAGLIAGVVGGNLGGGLAYVVGIGGLIGLLMLYGRRGQKAMLEAPIRSGITQIRLSPEGYALEHPGHTSLTRWSHVPGVIATPQALLILHSDYEYYPIEAAAFRDAEEMKKVAAQIQDWIAATGPADPETAA
ncbi:YcxB family protein (plasmid) [Aliiroseovarius crassostreae]|uniref:YcxB family protein n=1 Tax=Aliiroseovarius crassostreae TaxID=154981 RepID=UPI002200241F|nr:YcxB family protein [Aliiroseovarius crassostreae]UWQ12753.1 YcxB family protein [Aliiroseovarius crassostreae]